MCSRHSTVSANRLAGLKSRRLAVDVKTHPARSRWVPRRLGTAYIDVAVKQAADGTYRPWMYCPRPHIVRLFVTAKLSEPYESMSPPSGQELLETFGRSLREKRKRQGLSQEELAARASLDRSYVGGIERGERNVSLENLAKLARGLDISLSELFSGIEGSSSLSRGASDEDR